MSEPQKIVHISDRENDIYKYFCRCVDLGSNFLVRSCVNRLANEATITGVVATYNKSYQHTVFFTGADGKLVETSVRVKVKSLTLHPPIGKASQYQDLKITVVSAVETTVPTDRERIKWTFLTNLPVVTKDDSLRVLYWYKQRWKIDTYFKILKSSLKVDKSKLRTADRLSGLISICCILTWRIQWITMLNRGDKKLSPRLDFDELEIRILTNYFKLSSKPQTLQDYIHRLARLGGYLARANDPPPGTSLIWWGMNKLIELRTGFEMAIDVGNRMVY